jgi:hypothetical protein
MEKVTAFISKYWKHPVAIGIYILIAIYIIYKIGKSKGTSAPSKLPNETSWGQDLTQTEATNIRRLVERLHRDMTDYWVSSGFKDRDVEAYMQWLQLNDKEFVAVSNDFNDLYYDEGDGNLYQWLFDESFTLTAGASGDLRETLLQRMEKHNLK